MPNSEEILKFHAHDSIGYILHAYKALPHLQII